MLGAVLRKNNIRDFYGYASKLIDMIFQKIPNMFSQVAKWQRSSLPKVHILLAFLLKKFCKLTPHDDAEDNSSSST